LETYLIVVELLYITEVLEPRLIRRESVFENIEDRHTAVVLSWSFLNLVEVSSKADRSVQLLVDASVLGEPGATAGDCRDSEFATIPLRREVRLDRLDGLVTADTPLVAGVTGVVPWGIVAKTDLLNEEFLHREVVMLLQRVGQPREAVVSQPLVAGSAVIWLVSVLPNHWSDLAVVELDQLVE